MYYEGLFVCGRRSGNGTEKTGDKQIREGLWDEGKMNGPGRLVMFKSKQEKGLSRVQISKKGILPNAEFEYVGDFVDDQFEGKGELLTCDGIWYVGDWRGGFKHGDGTLYTPGKETLAGKTFSKYEGHFRQDRYHG